MFDLVTVGHFSIDFIIPPGELKPRKRLGGPPTYTSASAKMIGSSVSVISKVGGDFPERYLGWLRRRGIDLTGLKIDPNFKTTSFLIKYYSGGRREMFLKSRAPPISVGDLESVKARAIHISPIVDEVPTRLMGDLSRAAQLASLDPQGLLRHFDSDGRVSLQRVDSLDFLKYFDVLKASDNELKALVGMDDIIGALRRVGDFGVRVAIATSGGSGALISYNGRVFYVPAAEPRRILDPTGAGDSFMGGFLAEYLRGEDILWCASVGSSISSCVIEEVGPGGLRGKRKIYERAEQTYRRIAEVT